jgi:Type I phosphodiesterase / nucleotide pyrophosphatase
MANPANIFVIIDGLGWEWVNTYPFLDSVARYRRPLESVLGYSVGAIPSILTGRFPEQHGRLTLFHRAMGESPFESLRWACSMPPSLVENRYARHLVKRMARYVNHFTGYFILYGIPLKFLPFLDVCEKSDIYKPGGIPGSRTIFDLLSDQGKRYVAYSYHDGADADLIKRIGVDLERGDADFYFLYLAGIDAFLHTFGDSDLKGAARCFKWYSDALTELYEIGRRSHGSARIHVFSDHGMAPTRRVADLQSKIDALPSRQPDDFLCLLDSTMARFWFFRSSARDQVMSAFDGDQNGRWLSKNELITLHAWFEDRRYGEEIYLMNEGTVIAPSHMGDVAARGMHGFHPDSPHSRAVFLSSEDYGSEPSHITDAFAVMSQCL